MALKIQEIQRSAGAPGGGPNEDRTGVAPIRSGLLGFVIDGATSPDPTLRTGDGLAGEWLAERVASTLMANARPGALRDQLRGAVEATGPSWRADTPEAWPDWAQPQGAISLLRLSLDGDGLRLEGLHLGDCPAAILRSDGRIEALHAWHGTGPGAARRLTLSEAAHARMILDLKAERARALHEAPPRVLCLDPACAAGATASHGTLEAGDAVIVVSDGLARAWNEYGLCTPEEGAQRLAGGGFEMLLDDVRRFERTDYAERPARLMRASDDASAVVIALS